MSLRTPLGRALGKGSAGGGTGHWWQQRVTAIALIPLSLWFVCGLLTRHAASYTEIVDWLSRPWPALLAMLLVMSLAWHSKLGVDVVIEDYVHAKGVKTAWLLISIFAHALAALAGVFALLRLAHGS
jgi:succinate dehydrogenase / fumarate reductase membrane anchor subunit